MAQIEFYFNDSEWEGLFEYLQISGSKLIPDSSYDTEEYYIVPNF